MLDAAVRPGVRLIEMLSHVADARLASPGILGIAGWRSLPSAVLSPAEATAMAAAEAEAVVAALGAAGEDAAVIGRLVPRAAGEALVAIENMEAAWPSVTSPS